MVAADRNGSRELVKIGLGQLRPGAAPAVTKTAILRVLPG